MAISFTVELESTKKIVPNEKGIQKSIDDALIDSAKLIQKTARNEHRYKRRTGNLRKATIAKYSKAKSSITAEIKDSLAEYGKFVHGGHGKWAPDEFITESIKSNEEEITKLITKSIDDYFKKEGF